LADNCANVAGTVCEATGGLAQSGCQLCAGAVGTVASEAGGCVCGVLQNGGECVQNGGQCLCHVCQEAAVCEHLGEAVCCIAENGCMCLFSVVGAILDGRLPGDDE